MFHRIKTAKEKLINAKNILWIKLWITTIDPYKITAIETYQIVYSLPKNTFQKPKSP